ncbi:MAG: hypothetical protein WCF84_27480 [Anaerolineae bacterium]
MKTPYGKECKYYYSDYFRGHESQNCRLLEKNPNSDPWSASLCQTCPAPEILAANASPNLRLRGSVGKGFLGLTKKVQVEAFCVEHGIEIKDAKGGCPQCQSVKAIR